MIGRLVVAGAVTAAMGAGGAARASVLSFTYAYPDGKTFGATVEGAFEADGNLFDVSKVDQVYGNGAATFANPGQIVLVAGSTTLSLNGAGIKFLVNSSAGGVVVDVQNTASSTYTTPSASSHVFTYGANLPSEGYTVFIPSGYSAGVVNTPEPATVGLVLAGLLGVGATRRVRRG